MKSLSYFVVALLIVGSVAAIGIGKEAGEVENANIFDHRDAETMPFEVIKLGEGKKSTGLAGNTLVSINSEDEDQWPAITQDGEGRIVVTWTHKASILESNFGFGYSSDSGGSFTASLVALEEIAMTEFSDIAYVHDVMNPGDPIFDGLWGVFGGPMDNIYGFYYMTDITDEETYYFSSWTGEAPDIAYAAIADNTWYHELNYDYTGPTNMYICYSDLCSLDACPQHIVTGIDEEGAITGGVFYHDCQQDLDTAPAKDCDMACVHDTDPEQTLEDFVVLTWQYEDHEEGSTIVFKRIEFNTEPDIEYTPYEGYIGPGTNPNVGASGDNVVVCYMNGGNIVSAYSSDEGDTFAMSTIGPGKFPAVFMDGSDATCAYVNEGDLYLVKSGDGGQTWGTPAMMNDVPGTVVEGENEIDVHPAGLVWTDNRDGNMDIYYAPAGNAPFKPSTPDGPIEGAVGESQTYSTSAIDPNGDDISYGWDWDGDGVVDEWTDFKSSGSPVSTSHTWTSGFTGEIKVRGKDTNDEEGPWSDPLPVSMPRSKHATYPLLQKFLELFSNASPLLKYILGL